MFGYRLATLQTVKVRIEANKYKTKQKLLQILLCNKKHENTFLELLFQ